jgi:hypothetical protein
MLQFTPPATTSGAMPGVVAATTRARATSRRGGQAGSAPASRAAPMPAQTVTVAGYHEPFEIRLADQLITVWSVPFYVDVERVSAAVAAIQAAVPGSSVSIAVSAQ